MIYIHPGYIYFQLYLATGSPASKLDQNSTNGVVQVLDEVMFPPRTSFWDLFDSNFSIFKQLIENVDLSIEFIGEFDSYAFLVELFLNEFVIVFEIVGLKYVHCWKSVNSRAILRHTGKIPT